MNGYGQGNEQILTAVTEPVINGKIVTGTFEIGDVVTGTTLYIRAVKTIDLDEGTVIVKSLTAKVKVKIK